MPFRPNANDCLTIDGVTYCVAEHPVAPGMPYGQEGRQAIVYRLLPCFNRAEAAPTPPGPIERDLPSPLGRRRAGGERRLPSPLCGRGVGGEAISLVDVEQMYGPRLPARCFWPRCSPGARAISTPFDTGFVGWSPDGQRIAFERQDGGWEIYVMNADGSGLTRLTDNPASDENPAWCPVP